MTADVATFVHDYLRAPSGGDAVTFLLLHGTGGSEHDLLHLGPMLDEGAGLLAPRGQVLENGQPRFFRRLAEGVFDLDDLRVRADGLADWVQAAARHYAFDARRIVAVGYSNGANMAASLLLLEPGLLAGAVLFRPLVPIVPERLPPLRGVAVLIAAGRADATMAPEQPERLAELLRSAGADVVLHWDNAGHALDRREIAAARDWLARRHLVRGLKVHDPPL
jgi:phospholipase/carboxylesterase/glyoxalase family protein